VAGTKKISQLDNLSNDILTGEAIIPVVIADPLIPNRKAKVNQLFRGLSQGTKAAPGLCFDLDRDTGLYQNNYNEIGISFGTAGYYYSKIVESPTLSSAKIQAIDSAVDNVNIILQPKGSGTVGVQSGSVFRVQDTQFEIADDVTSTKKARFEVSNIGSGTKIFGLPTVTVGNSTTLVATDTAQTITNKVIRVDEDDFFVTDGNFSAKFGIDWFLTTGTATKTYFFPDPGPGVTTVNIIDDVSTQNLSNKTLIQPSFAANISTNIKALFNASNLTATRTVTFPDLSITLVGESSTQSITNKTYIAPIFADTTDPTKRVQFVLSNLITSTINSFTFPTQLNSGGSTSILVTERATQTLRNKDYDKPEFVDITDNDRRIVFDLSNITSTRTITFPNEDAILLSSNNTGTLEGIVFSGSISADSFGGRLRLRTHFLAGW
jgi:hypothetical protein